MAVISPAIGVQSGSHSALAFRQLGAALAGAAVQTFAGGVSALDVGHGLVRSGQLAVTQNGTPNMSVNVAAGTALVNGSSVLAQGSYAVTNDATVNLVIATADATNPRRDLVVVQVRDNTADASGFNDARLFVVTGTPAASPSDPAVPAGCLVLARVAVAALASSIVNANVTALAGLARGSNWNQAWGIVSNVVSITSVSTGVGAASWTTLAGSGINFTAVSGRRYRVHWTGALNSNHGAQSLALLALYDSSGPTKLQAVGGVIGATGGAGDIISVSGQYTSTFSAGAVTLDLRSYFELGTGNTVDGNSESPVQAWVEDIGPA